MKRSFVSSRSRVFLHFTGKIIYKRNDKITIFQVKWKQFRSNFMRTKTPLASSRLAIWFPVSSIVTQSDTLDEDAWQITFEPK